MFDFLRKSELRVNGGSNLKDSTFLLLELETLCEFTLSMYLESSAFISLDPVILDAADLIDSGSSVVKAASVKTGLSISFSIVDDRAKTGTDPVTPEELEMKVLLGLATTENLSKLSRPSLIMDKSPP